MVTDRNSLHGGKNDSKTKAQGPEDKVKQHSVSDQEGLFLETREGNGLNPEYQRIIETPRDE